MKTGTAGLELIKTFEGKKLAAYRDPVGIWTIGYGHTAAAGLPKPVKGMTITAQEADAILRSDLGQYEHAVTSALTRTPNQNQFDAMVSLCFNVGPKNFKGSSIVTRFNEGKTALAADRFLAWNKANKKVMRGLTRRREAERALFLTPVVTQPAPPAPVPAPPPVQPPSPQPPAPPAPTGVWAWLKSLFA